MSVSENKLRDCFRRLLQLIGEEIYQTDQEIFDALDKATHWNSSLNEISHAVHMFNKLDKEHPIIQLLDTQPLGEFYESIT